MSMGDFSYPYYTGPFFAASYGDSSPDGDTGLGGPFNGPDFFGTAFFGTGYFLNGGQILPVLDLRAALAAYILADPACSAVFGNRVAPVRVPQGYVRTQAICVLRKVQDVPDHDLLGPVGTSWAQVRFEVSSKHFADLPAGVKALRFLLDGYAGTLPGQVPIMETVLDGEEDLADPPNDASGDFIYTTGVDVLFHYRQPKPPRVPYQNA